MRVSPSYLSIEATTGTALTGPTVPDVKHTAGVPAQVTTPADPFTERPAHTFINDRICSLREVKSLTGNPSTSSIYRWIDQGILPEAPIPLVSPLPEPSRLPAT